VYYDYDKANGDDVAFADKFRVFLTLRDEEVLGTDGPIVAEAKITDVSDYQKADVKYFRCPSESASEGDGKLGVFDVNERRRSGTDYQAGEGLSAVCQSTSQVQAIRKKSPFWGECPTLIYVATSGESRLERARQHIAMRTFKQFYYTEKGWRSEERPPIDCHAYYCWATGSCTVGAQNGRTLLGRLCLGHVHPTAAEATFRNWPARVPFTRTTFGSRAIRSCSWRMIRISITCGRWRE